MTPCSPPSRRGLATAECAAAAQRRPSLTASARDVVAKAGRDEETALWSNKETLARLASACGIFGPRRSTLNDSISVDQQLSCASDERFIVSFAVGDQTG